MRFQKENQPKGLYTIFLTGLWERFGFYTLQAIIILYMSKSLSLSDSKAYLLFAVFTALLYVTPIIGGYLADHYIGVKRSIIMGSILLMVGYSVAAVNNINAFFFGLSIIICANGLFKPNISTIVGTLYDKNDSRRDGGYTLFYMGINIGALVPPLISGYVVRHYGWHAGFTMAAIGMFVGFLIFMWKKKSLGKHGDTPQHSPLNKKGLPKLKFNLLFYSGIILTILLCYYIFHIPTEINLILNFSAVVIAAVVFAFMLKETPAQRKKMFASVVLIAISVGFWAMYNQTFTSLMLYADRNVDKTMLGFHLDTEMTQFFNCFFIILLSPFLSKLWIKLGRRDLDPSIPAKFAASILFMSLSFFLLAVISKYFSHNGLVSIWWLALCYLLQTVGELLISPIGLSMITVLSPPKLVGLMMGVWFFAQAEAGDLTGVIAKVATIPQHLSAIQSLPIYTHAFMTYGLIMLVLCLFSFSLVPFLKKLIH